MAPGAAIRHLSVDQQCVDQRVTPSTISGALVAMFLYDICEEIRLDELRTILGLAPAGREPSFRQPAPAYVQFDRPPVLQSLAPVVSGSGERLSGRIAWFDYGVMSLNLELPFSGSWEDAVQL